MRHAFLPGFGAFTLVLSLATGCEMQGLSVDPAGTATDITQAEPPADDPTAALAAQTQAQAQRIANITDTPSQPPRDIIWRDLTTEPLTADPIEPEQPTADVAEPDPAILTVAENTDEPVEPVIEDTATQPRPQTPAERQAGLSQAQAYSQLVNAVRYSDDSQLSKARLTAATLGAIGPHGELDWSLLQSLSPQDQERVRQYHKAISVLREQVLTGDGPIDQKTLTAGMQEVFGSQPVTIKTIELCEKVLGFGVYDTFPERVFPAGRDQKMIIYVELDHFTPARRDQGDGYEVRLRQELELYESNGFEVWSHEPVQIVDISHNQRRDFFVVQLVTLPGQLAMGQYHLKVRIYDENAGTRDEASIPIRIVADDALVQNRIK